jgi:hypothetical protein
MKDGRCTFRKISRMIHKVLGEKKGKEGTGTGGKEHRHKWA